MGLTGPPEKLVSLHASGRGAVARRALLSGHDDLDAPVLLASARAVVVSPRAGFHAKRGE